jgi:hypothetical protein
MPAWQILAVVTAALIAILALVAIALMLSAGIAVAGPL